MANLKEVRTRIESVQSTRQITSAMKMVAASKLRKAQNAVMTLRPYSNRLNNILDNITASLADDQQSPFSEKREAEKVLMVLISSNKGLCGAFNTNVIKRAKQLIANKYKAQADAGNLQMICAGKKVSEIFAKSPVEVLLSKDDLLDNPSFDDVAALAEEVMQLFLEKKTDKVILIYNQFKNAATQIIQTEDFLPVIPEPTEHQEKEETDYIFEPGRETIVKELVPKILKVQLFKAFLDSFAAEHGARMTAMHQATDNATTLLGELKLAYNKARQAAITNEILEIVSGAEALKG